MAPSPDPKRLRADVFGPYGDDGTLCGSGGCSKRRRSKAYGPGELDELIAPLSPPIRMPDTRAI